MPESSLHSTSTHPHLGGLRASRSLSTLRDPGTRPASSLPDSVDAETSSPDSSDSLPWPHSLPLREEGLRPPGILCPPRRPRKSLCGPQPPR